MGQSIMRYCRSKFPSRLPSSPFAPGKERSVFIRIVRTSPQADQIDEFILRWNTYFPTRFSQMAGFRHAYVGYDQATNAIVSVSVWDTHPGEAALAETVAEFRPMVDDISSGPPVFEWYEVRAEI